MGWYAMRWYGMGWDGMAWDGIAMICLIIISVYAELVFLCAFVFEMVIRMNALGPNYYDSAFNKFDCVVIFGSIFEVVWVNFKPCAGSFGLSGLYSKLNVQNLLLELKRRGLVSTK